MILFNLVPATRGQIVAVISDLFLLDFLKTQELDQESIQLRAILGYFLRSHAVSWVWLAAGIHPALGSQ